MAVCVGHPFPSRSLKFIAPLRAVSLLYDHVYMKTKSYRYGDKIIIESFDMSLSSFSNPYREHIIYCYYYYYYFFRYLIFLMSYSRARRLLSSRIYVYYMGSGVAPTNYSVPPPPPPPGVYNFIKARGDELPPLPPLTPSRDAPYRRDKGIKSRFFREKEFMYIYVIILHRASGGGGRRRIYWFWPVGI